MENLQELQNRNLEQELWYLYKNMTIRIMESDDPTEIWRLSNIIVNTPPEVCEEIGGQRYLEELIKFNYWKEEHHEDIFIWRDAFAVFHRKWDLWHRKNKLQQTLASGSLQDITKCLLEEARLSAWSEYANAAFIEYDGDREPVVKYLEYIVEEIIEYIDERFGDDTQANKVIKILRNKDTELDLRIMAAYAAVNK